MTSTIGSITKRLEAFIKRSPFIAGFLLIMLVSCPCIFCASGSMVLVAFFPQATPDMPTTPITTTLAMTTTTIPMTITNMLSLTPATSATSLAPITPTVYPIPATPMPTPTVTTAPPLPTPYPYPSPTVVAPTRAPYPYPYPYPYPAPVRPTNTPYPVPAAPQPVESPSPASTQTPVTDTNTEPNQVTVTSSGIGIDRVAWETQQGAAQSPEGFLELYKDGAFAIQYHKEIIKHLERRWRTKDSVPIEDARDLAVRFIPSDSILTQTLPSTTGRIVDHYHSDWLATRYPDTDSRIIWGYDNPGDFTVMYKQVDDRTESFIISTDTSTEISP